MRPFGPVPLTLPRSTPCAAATRCATGVTFRPVGRARSSRRRRRPDASRSASGFGATLAGAAPLPLGHARDDLADGDGVAGVGEQLGERAGGRRGDLRVHLVGGDLDDRLVLGDAVAGLLGPLEDRALGDGLAHRGHLDLDDGSPRRRRPRRPAARLRLVRRERRPGAVRPGAISASTLPTPTVSPSAAWILTTVPETGAGTSASTLSVEISTRVSSSETASPSCLCHSRMEPSETESPIGGMTTSTVVFTAISRS